MGKLCVYQINWCLSVCTHTPVSVRSLQQSEMEVIDGQDALYEALSERTD